MEHSLPKQVQQEQTGEFDAGELDRMLAEGEASGEALAGEDVLAELKSKANQFSHRWGTDLHR